MPIRTLLVTLDGTEQSQTTLEVAMTIVRVLGVHADVLHVRKDPLEAGPALGEPPGARLADEMAHQAHREAERLAWRARDIFHARCAHHGVRVIDAPHQVEGPSAAWLERIGHKHLTVARLGRVHDLTVVGQPTDKRAMADSLTLDALFETGRPALVVPGEPPAIFGRRIAIAWNGSAECARAVGGATDFLARAESLVILTAESPRTPASVVPELATYLEWHGLRPETRVFVQTGREHLGGETLLDACRAEGADMLVMGARTTNRVQRFLPGRATGDILRGAHVPVLMGH